MTDKMIKNRVAKYFMLQEQKKALEKQLEAIANELKVEMLDRDTEHIETTAGNIHYTLTTRKSFDSSALKEDYPQLYNSYFKFSAVRRFAITG